MDTSEVNDVAKQCFNLKIPLYDKLNVLYNKSSLMLVCWNKYQIFLHENMNIEGEPITFIPEFLTHDIIISDHYLVCLDNVGNIHVHSLKFKNPAQKRFKGTFQPRDQGIAAIVAFTEDYTLSIKLENDNAHLCLHRITVEYQLKTRILLKCNFPISPLHKLQAKCILKSHCITKSDHDHLKDLFKTDYIENESVLVIITFDGMDVYSCLFNQRMPAEELNLVRLYSCPLQIQGIQLLEAESLDILIGLKSGTIIRLPFGNGQLKPQVIHLNTSISKFIAFKDTLIYTDGQTMWKSEKTFTQKQMRLTQLFVKMSRDFIMFDDQILCVTYSNLLYLFTLEDENVYIKSLAENDYYAAEKFLETSTQHDKITRELMRNLELSEKMRVESNYIAAMALANRQDVIKEVIKYRVFLFDNYEEASTEESDLKLTNAIHEYFQPETVLFLIKVKFLEQHKLNDVFVSLLQDLKLHVTIFSGKELLKTVSVSVDEVIKELKILTPLKNKEVSSVTIKIKLVPGLPGAMDKNQRIWIVLSEEEIILNSEHFIRSSTLSRKTICLKNSQRNLEDLILESANIFHGQLFSFTDITKRQSCHPEWNYYIKLPKDYSKLLSKEEIYLKHFNKAKSAFLLKTFSSQDFLRTKTQVEVTIGTISVCLKIIEDDFSGFLLMISSCNIKTGQHLRNFFSAVLYEDYENYGPGKVFVPQAQYAIIEDLQRRLKECLDNGIKDEEAFQNLSEQFQKNVLGALPL